MGLVASLKKLVGRYLGQSSPLHGTFGACLGTDFVRCIGFDKAPNGGPKLEDMHDCE